LANIEKRVAKDGMVSYRAKVRMKGYPVVTATFERKTDAKQWASQTEAEIRQGKYFKTAEAKKHTLTEVINRYNLDVLPKRNSDQKKMAMHLAWWGARIGAYTLADITSAMLAESRDYLAREANDKGITKSPATVNRYMASLSTVLSTAVEWGWLDENPFRKVKSMTEPRGRVRFLSKEENSRLMAACKASKSPHLYNVVLLALSTGARYSEIMTLTWQNIDFHRQTMRLENTKNGERRTVPVTGLAWQHLLSLSKVRKLGVNLIFPAKNGKKPADIQDAWDAALDRAQISDFRFHDLRHTAASNLAMSGASLLEIAQILGHKTLAMVLRYAHLTEQHTASVLSRMNEVQFEGLETKQA
jgi:integrase